MRKAVLFGLNLVSLLTIGTICSEEIATSQRNLYVDESVLLEQLTANDSTSLETALQDEVFASRIENMYTRVPLAFNKYVKREIKKWLKTPIETGKLLGHSHVYYPVFDEIFSQYDIPRFVNALALVESGFKIKAQSHMGATGLWQFMPETATEMGLQINSVIDERNDPYAATHAAAQYLSQLHERYGDWLLAIAAYNCGAGNVNKAIRRSGGHKNFWKIRPYLPRETRAYIPRLIAANYMINFHAEHDIEATWPGFSLHYAYDVEINENKSLQNLATEFSVNPAELKRINPGIKQWNFKMTNNPVTIHLPLPQNVAFTSNFDSNEES